MQDSKAKLQARFGAKKKALEKVKKYAVGGMAKELKGRYSPKPAPKPEAPAKETKAEEKSAAADELDLSKLDEATLQALLQHIK